jgi:hypothetical protein
MTENNNLIAPRLLASLAIVVSLLSTRPCVAISETLNNPFVASSAEEAERWIKLLRFEKEPDVRVKQANLRLLDVAITITRIETSRCVDEKCLTIFRYELGQVFQIAIYCKPKMIALDRVHEDSSGKHVTSLELDIGENMVMVMTPSSFGPLISALREINP